MLLPETDIDGAIRLAERVRSAVAGACLDPHEEYITLSIGVSEWLDDKDSSSALIADADRALLEAKAAGRNRVMVSERVERLPAV